MTTYPGLRSFLKTGELEITRSPTAMEEQIGNDLLSEFESGVEFLWLASAYIYINSGDDGILKIRPILFESWGISLENYSPPIEYLGFKPKKIATHLLTPT